MLAAMDRQEHRLDPLIVVSINLCKVQTYLPIPTKVILLLSDELSVWYLEWNLGAIRPCLLTWLICDLLRYQWRTSEIDTQAQVIIASGENARNIEVVLSELVVGRRYMLIAEFDACERIQSLEK